MLAQSTGAPPYAVHRPPAVYPTVAVLAQSTGAPPYVVHCPPAVYATVAVLAQRTGAPPYVVHRPPAVYPTVAVLAQSTGAPPYVVHPRSTRPRLQDGRPAIRRPARGLRDRGYNSFSSPLSPLSCFLSFHPGRIEFAVTVSDE